AAAAPGAAPAATCATPDRMTTVTVELSEYSLDFLQQRIPCGTVTFVETNDGTLDHDVDLVGVPGGAGPVIHPGDKARFTVSLAPGTYEAQCDVPGHAALGMVGQITAGGWRGRTGAYPRPPSSGGPARRSPAPCSARSRSRPASARRAPRGRRTGRSRTATSRPRARPRAAGSTAATSGASQGRGRSRARGPPRGPARSPPPPPPPP